MTQRPAAPSRSYVRLAVLIRYFGQLCLVLGGLTLVPMTVSFRLESPNIGLRYGIVVTALLAFWLLSTRARHTVRGPTRPEALLLIALVFVAAPLLLTIPMMGTGLSFMDALFEAVSAVTTTGLSTLPSVENLPQAFLFGRAWAQWYGGLGVVVFSLALVTPSGVLARRLGGTDNTHDDLLGGTKAHARYALLAYSLLTAAAILSLWLAGEDPLTAFTYGLASVSTGGFASKDASLAGLQGWASPAVVTLFCVAGAVSLGWYRRVASEGFRAFNDPQVRMLLVLGGFFVIATGTTQALVGGGNVAEVASRAPMMALSAQSTAGFSIAEPRSLDQATRFLLILAMFIGGGVGSTAGGMKLLRVLVLFKVLQALVMRSRLSPHAVYEPKIGNTRVSRGDITDAATMGLLLLGVVVLSWFLFLIFGYDGFDALFEVVSASGTVGLSAGLTSSSLPALLKLVLCIDMWMGRLEILPMLLLINPVTWMRARWRQP